MAKMTAGLSIRTVKGNDYYVLRFTRDGRRIERSLGRCDSISRAEARLRAAEIISAPVEERQKNRGVTFGECWQEALEDIAVLKQWRNPESRNAWRHAFEDLALPHLRDLCVRDITTPDVVALLKQYWFDKPETASRLRMRLEAFFSWAKVRGHCGGNPAVWRGNIDQYLPARGKVSRVKHHEAPTLEELGDAVAYCLSHPSPVSGAILFTIATVARISEVRLADASEIQKSAGVWVMPAERRKDGQDFPHRVPLSSLARKALAMAEKKGLLFTATGQPLALDSPRMKLAAIIGRQVTIHGVRSCFRDWAAQAGVADVLAEKSLSHSWGTEVTAAYLRTDLLEQRRPILEQWAEVLLSQAKTRRQRSRAS